MKHNALENYDPLFYGYIKDAITCAIEDSELCNLKHTGYFLSLAVVVLEKEIEERRHVDAPQ
jgi:hypothetical protein